MLLFAAALIAASTPDAVAPRPVGASVRATASVRIISGTTISWNDISGEQPRMRLTQVRDATGTAQPIRLIEFE